MGSDGAEAAFVNLFPRLVGAAAAIVGVTAAVAVSSAALAGPARPATRVQAVAVDRPDALPLARPVTAAVPVTPKPAAKAPAVKAPVVKAAVHKPRVVTRTSKQATSTPTSVRTVRATAASTASSYLRGCDGTSGWQKRRGAYAMRRITYNWRKTGYTIVFLPARRGITGMTYPSTRRIEVYVRSCSKMTNAYLAETIAHEIGHAVDFTLGTDAWQRKWQLARHISLSIPWYGAPYATDFSTPAGDFAETFGAWQVPDGPNDSHWGRPSAAQLKLLIPLMNL